MLIELRYQCFIHACSGNYLGNIYLLFFLFFFFFFFLFVLCEASGRCFWDVWTVILYVRTVFLVVRTIWLIRPDVYSSCPDERVFATSTWHYVQTSLKFRPNGEPCRVKSHSPRAAVHFFASFCVFCRLELFMRSSHVHVSSLHFISSPGMYLYSSTNFFFKFSCLK